MKNDRADRLNHIVNSVAGSSRATPAPEMKDRIKALVLDQQTMVISTKQWSYMIAAAIMLLILNISVVRQRFQPSNSSKTENLSDPYSGQSLVPNFKLYQE